MTVTDPALIATQLLAVATAVAGVNDARLGLNALTLTPAAEIWLTTGTVTTIRAAPTEHLQEAHTLEAHFYTALRANQNADELLLARIARDFIRAIHHEDFDETLGGLVETTRCTRYAFDFVERNGHAFRTVAIEIEAGEL